MIEAVVYVTRSLLVISGLGVAYHYHLMANFMRRSPWWVKSFALPLASAGGVGMLFCGLFGEFLGAAIASSVAMTAVVAINLAAWPNGAHISIIFERQAQAKYLLKVRGPMNGIRADVEDLRDILTDSWVQELSDSQARSVERQP